MIIPDSHTPIIIPFGYAGIGKTMLVHRLVRYLRKKGLEATAVNNSTSLGIIHQRGKSLCYIIDLAGEKQCNLNNLHTGFSPEMNRIIQLPNPKIWCFMIEADYSLNEHERKAYVQKIHEINSLMGKMDKVIFIVSKVDCLSPEIACGSNLYHYINELYPRLFEPLMETNPILRLFKPMRFVFLPFTSGSFSWDCNHMERYCVGKDVYPQRLWNHLLKLL